MHFDCVQEELGSIRQRKDELFGMMERAYALDTQYPNGRVGSRNANGDPLRFFTCAPSQDTGRLVTGCPLLSPADNRMVFRRAALLSEMVSQWVAGDFESLPPSTSSERETDNMLAEWVITIVAEKEEK